MHGIVQAPVHREEVAHSADLCSKLRLAVHPREVRLRGPQVLQETLTQQNGCQMDVLLVPVGKGGGQW